MKDHIKRILVPLDPSPFSQAATEAACHISRVHLSQVLGVAVLDSSEIRASLVPAIGPYYPILIEEVRRKTEHASGMLKDCQERFARTCSQMRVAHLESEYEGIPARKLLESAIFYDLVVTGLRTSFHFETREGALEPLSEILDRTITPVLAVPAKGFEKPEKVVVAFDGSLGSARALHDYVRFAQPYSHGIKIVVAGKNKAESAFLLRNASAFLRAHGFENIEGEAIDGPIVEAVDSWASSGVNLIVAGIHSKKVFQDFFVGSFTRALIQRGDIALFLSH